VNLSYHGKVLHICLCVWVGGGGPGACNFAYLTFIACASYCDVTCDLSGFTVFFDIISQMVRFSGKKKVLNIKCVF
jgi:hypothetical protein